MFDAESSTPSPTPRPAEDPSTQPAAVPHEGRTVAREESAVEEPLSTSWPAVTAPWGTPGNHLTGPIPRIRRRRDGSLTHEDDGRGRGGEQS